MALKYIIGNALYGKARKESNGNRKTEYSGGKKGKFRPHGALL
jgi:hypothetical protein